MKSGQCNEQEFVSHLSQFTLELSNGSIIQILLPVERRGAVICEKFPRIFFVDGFGESASIIQIRFWWKVLDNRYEGINGGGSVHNE